MGRLLARDDSLLLVVDAQPGFYRGAPDLDTAPMRRAFARAAWLAGVATALGIPAVVTEEDAPANGPTDGAIVAALPETAPIFAKPVFGATDVPEIRAAIEATGRHTVVLVGLETDVCVAQTALGALDRGYRVVVAEDATFAPSDAHDAGIRRMADAGATMLHVKGVYYEWVRTLEAARGFERDHPELADPPGFRL
jgi:nicotinamidase-related amidase